MVVRGRGGGPRRKGLSDSGVRRASATHPFAGGIVQALCDELRRSYVAEDLDLEAVVGGPVSRRPGASGGHAGPPAVTGRPVVPGDGVMGSSRVPGVGGVGMRGVSLGSGDHGRVNASLRDLMPYPATRTGSPTGLNADDGRYPKGEAADKGGPMAMADDETVRDLPEVTPMGKPLGRAWLRGAKSEWGMRPAPRAAPSCPFVVRSPGSDYHRRYPYPYYNLLGGGIWT